MTNNHAAGVKPEGSQRPAREEVVREIDHARRIAGLALDAALLNTGAEPSVSLAARTRDDLFASIDQLAALATQAAPEAQAEPAGRHRAWHAQQDPKCLYDGKDACIDCLMQGDCMARPAASGERDTLRALLREVFDAMDEGDGQAPGHGHSVRGQWDDTGAPCTWCATWIKVRAALADGGAK